jgi:hypothetical protein
MDFMKWLNSLGDLLYEVMSWLVFYPITLWRATSAPLSTMTYSQDELHDRKEEQFTDTLNPPLFLILSLLLTQLIAEALGGGVNPLVAKRTGLASLITDDTTLLAFRLLLFSLFPLLMATRFTRAKKLPLTRARLKSPFYAQCYACAPFALFLGIGMALVDVRVTILHIVGVLLALGSLVAYLSAETVWFSRHLGRSLPVSFLHVARAFIEAAIAALAIGLLVLSR